MLRSTIRMAWRSHWEASTRARTLFFRTLRNTFFSSVGEGTRFFGWPRFGTCEGNISIGAGCLIGRDVFFSAHRDSRIAIGNQCSVNTQCHMVALYEITIGDGTRIGEFVSIRDQNHANDDPTIPVSDQGYTGGPINIGKNCWIGRGVFIGPNVTIGDGAIIAANAVVVKNVLSNSIVGGVPAKLIRQRPAR